MFDGAEDLGISEMEQVSLAGGEAAVMEAERNTEASIRASDHELQFHRTTASKLACV